MDHRAFVLRIAPGGIDHVREALKTGHIIIGWAYAIGLLDEHIDWERFRQIIRKTYYSKDKNLRRAGNASGNMWRFIHEMKVEDIVVVPHGPEFYVARIEGPAVYDESKVEDDSAYRRKVEWLNSGKSIPRYHAKSALISRMKTQGTCVDATDLLDDIHECIKMASSGSRPSFQEDLQRRLIREALDEIRSGRMESFGFERLIASMLHNLGATETVIIPRNKDKGADIVATFLVAGAFQQKVAVQAKHWQPEPPVGTDVVEQLISGIEAESANLGMIITSGSISAEATRIAEEYFEDKGISIELIDGEQFAKLIVESGIKVT